MTHTCWTSTWLPAMPAGMAYSDFVRDSKTRRAVVNCLQEIGEASKKLPAGFRQQHPLIPWADLISHRNYLAHEYFRADYGEVWNAATRVLPGLIEYLEPLLPPETGA